jgi:hypothetical protein
MLLTGPIKKASDAFIEWKEIAFFCAEVSLVEMVRNSTSSWNEGGRGSFSTGILMLSRL